VYVSIIVLLSVNKTHLIYKVAQPVDGLFFSIEQLLVVCGIQHMTASIIVAYFMMAYLIIGSVYLVYDQFKKIHTE